MHKIPLFAPTSAAVIATFAACATAQPSPGAYIDMSTCRDVSTQIEIDGAMQPVLGRACLQPDGNWMLVGAYDGSASYPYVYGYGPWYWGGPILIGGSFVFVDRFHHFHHRNGGFRPGMGRRPAGMGHGWHGGGGWGGGMRRR